MPPQTYLMLPRATQNHSNRAIFNSKKKSKLKYPLSYLFPNPSLHLSGHLRCASAGVVGTVHQVQKTVKKTKTRLGEGQENHW